MKKLFYNGEFITMNGETCKSLLIDEGKIQGINCYEEFKDDLLIETIDLNGKTMLPSFIDSHSHLMSYANNLLEVSLNNSKSFTDITQTIKNYILKNSIAENQWIIANSYDQNLLMEKHHPHSYILDIAFPNNPVIIKHISGDMSVLNSTAMRELGLNMNSIVEGIGIENGKLNGYVEKKANAYYNKKIPAPTFERINLAVIEAQNCYASNGITTIQEGIIFKELLPVYDYILDAKTLFLDVVGYASFDDLDEIMEQFEIYFGNYKNNFRIDGLKVILDGSPQARTAWMRTPYKNSEGDYFSNGTMSNDDLQQAITLAKEMNIHLVAHCNGDRACQQFIEGIAISAMRDDSQSDFRPTMIHAQLLGIDQLDEVYKLKIIPSFCFTRTKNWGDIHIQNFGLDRATKICPTKSALSKGIEFTLHQDSLLASPNVLETIQTAVTRVTQNGVLLGENERISVYDALRASTISCAFQYGEENQKGELAVGKYADLVILSENPLTADIFNIENIEVITTIKRGNVIFEKYQTTNNYN